MENFTLIRPGGQTNVTQEHHSSSTLAPQRDPLHPLSSPRGVLSVRSIDRFSVRHFKYVIDELRQIKVVDKHNRVTGLFIQGVTETMSKLLCPPVTGAENMYLCLPSFAGISDGFTAVSCRDSQLR